MDTKLDEAEVRVLGCLIEKELATPEYYPLSLNALVNACNQKSNRDPLMNLEEEAVVRALDSLRFKQLALLSAEGGGYRNTAMPLWRSCGSTPPHCLSSGNSCCAAPRRWVNCAPGLNACIRSQIWQPWRKPCRS